MGKLLELTPALDGARVLYRHWRSTRPMTEGFVREFSPDKSLVRISSSKNAWDAGSWHRALELRVEAVLDDAKAPVAPPTAKGEDSQ